MAWRVSTVAEATWGVRTQRSLSIRAWGAFGSSGEDVQARAAQPARRQGGDQGVLIHYLAARHIDQHAVWAKRRQHLGRDQAARRCAARHDDDQHVDLGRQVDQIRHVAPGRVGDGAAGVIGDLSGQRGQPVRRWPGRCGPGPAARISDRMRGATRAAAPRTPNARRGHRRPWRAVGAASPAPAAGPGPPRRRSARRGVWVTTTPRDRAWATSVRS